MDTEHWKPIPGHDGYEASSLGRIRSKRKVLADAAGPRGHRKIALGSKCQGLVHTFVALAFYGQKPDGMCVAHKNGNPGDNRVENIQYTTFVGNMLHRRFHGQDPCPVLRISDSGVPRILETRRGKMAFGEVHGMCTASEAQARMVHELLAEGLSRREIVKRVGMDYQWVSNVAAGRRWRHVHPDLSIRR